MIASSHIHHIDDCLPRSSVWETLFCLFMPIISLLFADFLEIGVVPLVNVYEELSEKLVNRMNKHRVIYNVRVESIDSCQLANNDEDDN